MSLDAGYFSDGNTGILYFIKDTIVNIETGVQSFLWEGDGAGIP